MSISHDQYRRAKVITENAADMLWDHLRKGARGPEGIHPRILLIGMLLAIDDSGTATIRKIHEVLTTSLAVEMQRNLGVITQQPGESSRQLTEFQLYEMTRLIRSKLEYSQTRAPHLSPEERRKRRDLIDALVFSLIKPTLMPRPEGSADYALDATGIWAHERAPKSLSHITVEMIESDEDTDHSPKPERTAIPAEQKTIDTPAQTPDARAINSDSISIPNQPDKANLPTRRETSRKKKLGTQWKKNGGISRRGQKGPSDATYGVKTDKDGKRRAYFGYEIQALVRVPMKSNGLRSEPPLVEELVILPASTDVVGPCLNLIDRVLSRGIKINHLLVDRHYSYKTFERWLHELMVRNIEQVADLREDDHGFTDWNGMKVTASTFHCPGVPDELGRIPAPGPNADDQKWETFHLAIEKRQPYALKRINRLNKDGAIKCSCPALDGTVGCSLRPETVATAISLGLPMVQNPPPKQDAPAVCTQGSVTINVKTKAEERLMKLEQKYYWGSRKWARSYRRRTYVEGWFGVFKSSNATGIDRGSHNFVGLPLVALVLATGSAVTNMRLIRSWQNETKLGDLNHPLLTPDQPDYGFTRLTKEQHEELERIHGWTPSDKQQETAA